MDAPAFPARWKVSAPELIAEKREWSIATAITIARASA
jgi:hypothetical protein